MEGLDLILQLGGGEMGGEKGGRERRKGTLCDKSGEMLMMVVRKEKAESIEGREMGQVKKGGVITRQKCCACTCS